MSTRQPTIDKEESRFIRVQIRRVLLEVWDPIGITDEPNAQNEYDSYIGPIYDLLTTGTDTKLIQYLNLVTNDRMGLTAKKSDMLKTVEALRKIPINSGQS